MPFSKTYTDGLNPGLSFVPFNAKHASEQAIWKSLPLADQVYTPNTHSLL